MNHDFKDRSKMMKKFWPILILTLMILTTFMITGCLPPNFTEQKAKDIAKEHHKDAVAWFQQYKPEAQVDKDCAA